jgi:hypothetical protein
MYGEMNRFTDEWQYLLNAKNQALSSASSTLAVLQQLEQIMATATSTPAVCDASVEFTSTSVPQIIYSAIASSTVQNEINRLTTEIQGLQVKINAADSVRTQIANADFRDEFQRNEAQIAYQNFINQYGTTAQIEAIVFGSARQAADTDAQTKQTELNNIQARLSACQAAINPPPAP